ncbi:MAG: hypothetical protein R3C30_14750 [Hyphomonadaceae bacterium]
MSSKPLKLWPLARILQIGELTAAVAVIISVIFVGVEIRQNSQAQVQATTQAAVSDYVSSLELIADNREFACLYTQGAHDFEALDAADRLRFSAFYMSTYYQLQEMHRLSEKGAIDADTWSGFHSLLQETTRYPGVRQWFAVRRSWFSVRFQTYVDELMREAPSIEESAFDDARGCVR